MLLLMTLALYILLTAAQAAPIGSYISEARAQTIAAYTAAAEEVDPGWTVYGQEHYSLYHGVHIVISLQRLTVMEPSDACDAVMSNEIADELLVHEHHLVGVAENTQEMERLVIAHWNGSEYDRIESTKPQVWGLYING